MSQSHDWLSSAVLVDLLREYPQGVSEHALLTCLQKRQHIHMDADGFHDLMKLFRMHFLLFHRLYRLRDELHAQEQGTLEIHTLCIRLLPYRPGGAGIEVEDPLRAYYLDLNQLRNTSEIELEAMLSGFWSAMKTPAGTAERHQALSLLELDSHATDQQIKQSWRRLAMRHHPDRGGDEEQLKQLNQAVSLLLPRH